MSNSKLNNQGFTLLEIMVVVVILSILAIYVAPKIMGKPDEARINAAMLQIKSFESALKFYKLHSFVYPTTEQGLDALVSPPESGTLPKNFQKGGYMDKIPKDPWGNDYIFLSPGAQNADSFDLMSYGADGQPGGEDENADINNWNLE